MSKDKKHKNSLSNSRKSEDYNMDLIREFNKIYLTPKSKQFLERTDNDVQKNKKLMFSWKIKEVEEVKDASAENPQLYKNYSAFVIKKLPEISTMRTQGFSLK